MPAIPIPELGDWNWVLVAGSLLAGFLLVLFGNRLHRFFLAVIGAGAGFLIGTWLADPLKLDILTARIGAAVVLGLLGLALARLIWALLATAISLAVSICVIADKYAPADPTTSPATTQPALESWRVALENMRLALESAWDEQSSVVLMVLVPAGLVPLLIGMLLPRLSRIVMTSLLGGAAVIFSALFATGLVWPDLWARSFTRIEVILAAMGLFVAVGLVVQYRGALALDRRKKEKQGESEDKTDEKPPTRKRFWRRNRNEDDRIENDNDNNDDDDD